MRSYYELQLLVIFVVGAIVILTIVPIVDTNPNFTAMTASLCIAGSQFVRVLVALRVDREDRDDAKATTDRKNEKSIPFSS